MHQREEVGNDALYLIRYIHLVAEQENLVLLQFKVALYLGEVEYTCEVEWKIDVQVNSE